MLIVIAVYGSKNLFWPRLKKIAMPVRIKSDDNADIRAIITTAHELKERGLEMVSQSASILGLERISERERAFLNTFARLACLVNALEVYVLIERMQKSFATVYAWFSNEMFDIIVRTIETLVQLKALVPKPDNSWETEAWRRRQAQTLQQEFAAAGMEDLISLEMLGPSRDSFFSLDFVRFVQSGHLRDELRQYLSVSTQPKSP